VVPPDRVELVRRLRGRGDDEEHVQRRLALADSEVDEGTAIADHVVVNDDLDRAVAEVAGILDGYRSSSNPRR
jgi:guanylate kinase